MTTMQQRLHHAAIDSELRGWSGLAGAFRSMLQRDIDAVGLDCESFHAPESVVLKEDHTAGEGEVHRPSPSPAGAGGWGMRREG
jgi:hypothetical protein